MFDCELSVYKIGVATLKISLIHRIYNVSICQSQSSILTKANPASLATLLWSVAMSMQSNDINDSSLEIWTVYIIVEN